MNATHPLERGRAKLEVEHCPIGRPFGSPSCTRVTSNTWTDVGTGSAGAVVSHDVPVPPNSLRRWRVRALRAPFAVTQAGITPPVNPAHGPWRRLEGQRFEGDVRIIAATLAVESPRGTSEFAFAPLGNPARGRIMLAATLPAAGPADLEVFDIAGRLRRSHRIESAGAGAQKWPIDGSGIESGVYLMRLTQGGRAATARVVFIR